MSETGQLLDKAVLSTVRTIIMRDWICPFLGRPAMSSPR